jgi:hypothetical protein
MPVCQRKQPADDKHGHGDDRDLLAKAQRGY